jgi:ubiquitin-like protein ATG12
MSSSDSAPPSAASSAAPSTAVAKIVIIFQAAGGAPILKQDRVKISVDSRFSKVVAHLKKQLHSDSVFVYLRNAFCPALDEEVGVLTQAYGTDGKLHVSYALTPAWG